MSAQKLQKFMQLTKVDVAKKRIHGVFTAEVVDKSGEIADYDGTKAAIKAWSEEISKASKGKSKGNIRKMHGNEVCGKAVEIVYDDVAKAIHGEVEVDDRTLEEADKGILNGFSIGGTYAKRWEDPAQKGVKRFIPKIAEVSVVDNPCVPSAIFDAIKDASFTVIKEDGTEEMRKFAAKEVETEQLDLLVKQLWQASDGSTHDTQEAALAKNEEIKAEKLKAEALAKLESDDGDDKSSELLKRAKDELSKAQGEIAALKKMLTDLPAAIEKKLDEKVSKQLEDIAKRVKKIEDQPAADNVHLTTVHKGGNDDGTADDKPTRTFPLNGRSPAAIANMLNS
jgi:hypothetical protein